MRLSEYLKNEYGRKLKKVSIDAGFSCPNRRSRSSGGCIFCSGEGSGDFALNCCGNSITERVAKVKSALDNQDDDLVIAYFQAYTNTYAPVDELRALFMTAANHPKVAVISIATRPDCLPKEVLQLLGEVNSIKPVWVELGLQSIHEATAQLINRGYSIGTYEKAVDNLCRVGVSQIITHIIVGLPGENSEMTVESVCYLADICEKYPDMTFGIKLALLHVLKDTELSKMYESGSYECLSFEEYVETVVGCLRLLPERMIVHRITGDGNRESLIAPMWSVNKKKVLNAIEQRMSIQPKAVDEKKVIICCISDDVMSDTNNLMQEFEKMCVEAGECFDAELIFFKTPDWMGDYSPWSARIERTPGDKEQLFAGRAGRSLERLKREVLPDIYIKHPGAKIYLAGYSLAGLFALWAIAHETDSRLFAGCVCCSGSLWFPGFVDYFKARLLSENSVCSGEESDDRMTYGYGLKVYISLGGKESLGGGVMSSIEKDTRAVEGILGRSPLVKEHTFEMNKGGHFANPDGRLIKGIKWILL